MTILTIAFWQLGAKDWHGGQTLVSNAIRAMRQARQDKIRALVIGDASAESVAYAGTVAADGLVACQTPARWSPRRIVNAMQVRLNDNNVALEADLRRAGVQAVVGESVGWRLGPIASIAWLWDFQHLHLRDLFDTHELERRNRSFRQSMRLADCLLATACVAEDARQFAPEYSHKIQRIRPYALIDPSIYAREPCAVVARFRLPEKFFYVPNQFWIHKNHHVLFQALHVLRIRRVRAHVVLTGRVSDYRAPQHFQRLMQQVEEWGLGEQVHYLGVVERVDVYDLIRQCICVVNPSLFEGWGYAVDEAAAIGKRILASDIPAHREQAAPACEFFDPRSTRELADKLEQIWAIASPGPRAHLEVQARTNMPARAHALGETLYQALNEAVMSRGQGI